MFIFQSGSPATYSVEQAGIRFFRIAVTSASNDLNIDVTEFAGIPDYLISFSFASSSYWILFFFFFSGSIWIFVSNSNGNINEDSCNTDPTCVRSYDSPHVTIPAGHLSVGSYFINIVPRVSTVPATFSVYAFNSKFSSSLFQSF